MVCVYLCVFACIPTPTHPPPPSPSPPLFPQLIPIVFSQGAIAVRVCYRLLQGQCREHSRMASLLARPPLITTVSLRRTQRPCIQRPGSQSLKAFQHFLVHPVHYSSPSPNTSLQTREASSSFHSLCSGLSSRVNTLMLGVYLAPLCSRPEFALPSSIRCHPYLDKEQQFHTQRASPSERPYTAPPSPAPPRTLL